jgi:hypothetical protein
VNGLRRGVTETPLTPDQLHNLRTMLAEPAYVEEIELNRKIHYAHPRPLARPPCYAGTCDKPGHYHMRPAS